MIIIFVSTFIFIFSSIVRIYTSYTTNECYILNKKLIENYDCNSFLEICDGKCTRTYSCPRVDPTVVKCEELIEKYSKMDPIECKKCLSGEEDCESKCPSETICNAGRRCCPYVGSCNFPVDNLKERVRCEVHYSLSFYFNVLGKDMEKDFKFHGDKEGAISYLEKYSENKVNCYRYGSEYFFEKPGEVDYYFLVLQILSFTIALICLMLLYYRLNKL